MSKWVVSWAAPMPVNQMIKWFLWTEYDVYNAARSIPAQVLVWTNWYTQNNSCSSLLISVKALTDSWKVAILLLWLTLITRVWAILCWFCLCDWTVPGIYLIYSHEHSHQKLLWLSHLTAGENSAIFIYLNWNSYIWCRKSTTLF